MISGSKLSLVGSSDNNMAPGVVDEVDNGMVNICEVFYFNYLQQAFKLGIIKEKSTVKYKNVIAKVSILDEQAVLFYGDIPYYSFYKFMLAFDKV